MYVEDGVRMGLEIGDRFGRHVRVKKSHHSVHSFSILKQCKFGLSNATCNKIIWLVSRVLLVCVCIVYKHFSRFFSCFSISVYSYNFRFFFVIRLAHM